MWHFQVTPGDNWDYDATQPLMLADLQIGGSTRKVIMQASKNGFFYLLDRQSGQFISAKAFIKGVTWANGIDSQTGRPEESASAHNNLEAVLVSPDPGGAHNWYPMAFNPTTGLVYVPAREGGVYMHAVDKNWKSNPTTANRGEDPRYAGPMLAKLMSAPAASGHLVAWNPVEQRERYHVLPPAGGHRMSAAADLFKAAAAPFRGEFGGDCRDNVGERGNFIERESRADTFAAVCRQNGLLKTQTFRLVQPCAGLRHGTHRAG